MQKLVLAKKTCTIVENVKKKTFCGMQNFGIVADVDLGQNTLQNVEKTTYCEMQNCVIICCRIYIPLPINPSRPLVQAEYKSKSVEPNKF